MNPLLNPPLKPPKQAPVWHAHAKLVFVAFCWGTTLIAGRIVAQNIPNLTAASGRFLIAALIFMVLLRSQGPLPKINAKQALVTAAMGLTGVFCFNFFFFTALEKVPASKVALIVSLSPILTALAVSLILKERLSFQRWCGILLAFLGVSIVITQGQIQDTLHYFTNSFESGEGFMMLSVSSWVAYTVLGRFALVGLTPLQATTYAALWGTAALFLATLSDIALWQASMLTWENTLAVLYIAIFGTVIASLWFLQGVRTLGPARTAVYANLTPIFGVVLGYLVLSEPIDLSMIVGGAIVILGVTLTNRARA